MVRLGKSVVLVAATSLSLCASARADDPAFSEGTRTRGLVGGAGHSWRPIFGKTRSDITFVAFNPRMGWFVTDRLELYGEGTLFLYTEPEAAVAAGLGGLSGRYYLRTSGAWIPYVHAGAGLLWTSLEVPEIDRIFNFQLFVGIGWRQTRARGPSLVFEFRNHHISNAGTAGKNLGINAATILAGVEWVLRPTP
jgi:lipid A 3-O-deacylase